jgi:hypothetical protein
MGNLLIRKEKNNIPNEIMLHHQSENFVCIKGYICKRDTYIDYDHHCHKIDEICECYVRFVCKQRRLEPCPDGGFDSGDELDFDEETNILANNAPSPPDYLDNHLRQQCGIAYVGPNYRRRNLADIVNELRAQNIAENRSVPKIKKHLNLASPPPEFDI